MKEAGEGWSINRREEEDKRGIGKIIKKRSEKRNYPSNAKARKKRRNANKQIVRKN